MINIAAVNTKPLFRIAIEQIFSTSTRYKFVQCFQTIADLEKYATKKSALPEVLFVEKDEELGTECENIRKLSCQFPTMKIIVITSTNFPTNLLKALQIGVTGYLLKSVTEEEINRCIDSIMEGNIYIQSNISYSRELMNQDVKHNLSKRELEVLHLILQEHTSQQIAGILYLSLSTIESHRSHLFTKMGTKNIVGLVKKAYELGLIE